MDTPVGYVMAPLARAHEVFMSRKFLRELRAAEQQRDLANYLGGLGLARGWMWKAFCEGKLIVTFTDPDTGLRVALDASDLQEVFLWDDVSEISHRSYLSYRVGGVMLVGAPQRPSFEHNDDYTYVRWRGQEYTFGILQANVIRLLHEAYLEGVPHCSGKQVLEEAGADSHN